MLGVSGHRIVLRRVETMKVEIRQFRRLGEVRVYSANISAEK